MIFRQLQREVNGVLLANGIAEGGRHHTDDAVRAAIDFDGRSGGTATGEKESTPDFVTQHHNTVAAGLFLSCNKSSAQHGRYCKDSEEVVRSHHRMESGGATPVLEVNAFEVVIDRDIREGAALATPVLKVRIGAVCV